MYVMSFVDNINVSIGPNSVTENVDIISVSDDRASLIQEANADGDVDWIGNDMEQMIGYALYDGVREEKQYYVIVQV